MKNIAVAPAGHSDIAAADQAFRRLLAAANGGIWPDHIVLRVTHPGCPATAMFDLSDGRDKLHIVLSGTRCEVAVGVGTYWTTIFHHRFRFARTPGNALILLGRHNDRPMHFWIEDGQIYADHGSPLRSADQEAQAIAWFDAEFAALMAGRR